MPGQHGLGHQDRRATAAALNKAGRRFTILPIVADSRTSARTRGLRTAAKRAKARRESAALVDEGRPGSRRPPALGSRPGPDAGASGARRRQPGRPDLSTTPAPGGGRRGHSAAGRRGPSLLSSRHRLGPRPEPVLQVLELALWCRGALRGAFCREPVGVVGGRAERARIRDRRPRSRRRDRVDRRVGDAAPRGVSGVPVAQRAVEVAGHNRVRAVGTDHRGGRPRSRVRQS